MAIGSGGTRVLPRMGRKVPLIASLHMTASHKVNGIAMTSQTTTRDGTAKVGARKGEPKTDENGGVDDHAGHNPSDSEGLKIGIHEIQG